METLMSLKTLLVCVALSLVAWTAHGAPKAPVDDGPEIMTVDELKAGMKGYGLTVFAGVRPERFDVEILGVLKGAVGPRKDMILCKATHPKLTEIGIVAGMSGSPVYIDGKLIGAIAYGWSYSREAIGGISPIENMLEVYDSAGQSSKQPASSGGGFVAPVAERMHGAPPISIEAARLPRGVAPRSLKSNDLVTLEPLSTPLMVGGVCPASMEILREAFGGYGFQIIPSGAPGGGDESETIPPDEISGGYALAIPMMSGDMDMSVAGTITYRKGDRLVAFGHPMYHRGDSNAPMSASRVHEIIPSRERPFKISSALNPLGTVTQDRLAAIGGKFGKSPRMVPISVHVGGKGAMEERTFRFQSIRDKEFMSSMARVALTESIASVSKAEGEASADISYRIVFSNGAVVEKRDFVSGSFIMLPLSYAAAGDISSILFNPFEEIAVNEIKMEVTLTDRLEQAQLVYLRPTRAVYKPGDTVEMRLTYQPWRKPMVTTMVEMELPDPLPNGTYTVTMHGPSSRAILESRRAPGRLAPLSLDQMVDVVKIHFPGDQSYLTLETKAQGFTLGANEFNTLPPSLRSAINASCRDFKSSAPIKILGESTKRWRYELLSAASATITVDQRGLRR